MRENWVKWVILAVVSAALGAFFAMWMGPPPPPKPAPPPGDVIIVRPRPVNTTPNSTYWLIGAALKEPIPVEEYGNNRLNANAFPYVFLFQTRVTLPSGGTATVWPVQLKAHFRHCKNTTVNQCDADADCGGSDTCVVSEMIVKRLNNTGTKDKFEWWLDGIKLDSYDYHDSLKWRGELCGRLVYPFNVDFTYNGTPYTDIPVPMSEESEINATTDSTP